MVTRKHTGQERVVGSGPNYGSEEAESQEVKTNKPCVYRDVAQKWGEERRGKRKEDRRGRGKI